MVNPFKEVNWSPDLAELRTFAKSLVIGFPCVALVFFLVIRISGGTWDTTVPLRIAGYGVSAGIVFWFLPVIARPFYSVWYALACCIGLVMANLLLASVYYGVATPIAIVMKLIGRDALRRKLDRNAKTYWQDAKQPSDPKRYYSQF